MPHQYRINYGNLTDEQIVNMILAEPRNEEAAYYLLHDRYKSLLRGVYYDDLKKLHIKSLRGEDWFDDCVHELFIHLKGKDCSWRSLATFEWRSTFGYWLTNFSSHKFLEVLAKLIENHGDNRPIDNGDSEKPQIQIPDVGAETPEGRLQKVLLMEAIGHLKDDEQFVILKRLQGYNSKEIAELLDKKWRKHNIVKFNHDGIPVVANVKYVDSKAQKAKKHLRSIMVESK